MIREEIEKIVWVQLAEQLRGLPDGSTIDSSLAALGVDSLDRIEISIRVEEAFDVVLTDAEDESLQTVRSIVDLVERKLGSTMTTFEKLTVNSEPVGVSPLNRVLMVQAFGQGLAHMPDQANISIPLAGVSLLMDRAREAAQAEIASRMATTSFSRQATRR